MKKLVWIIVLSISYIFFYILIDFFALSSIAKIKIVAEPCQDDHLTVYYSNGSNDGRFTQVKSARSQRLLKNEKTLISLNLLNRVGRYLRLDPIANEGKIKLYDLKVLSHFGDPIVLDAKTIYDSFRTNNDASMTLGEEFVLVESNGPDPQLILLEPIKFSNHFYGIILPIFLSILTTLIITNISLGKIYAIKDITNKKPSTTNNITALDGLRGFAALLVLAAHCSEYFKGLGNLGVWIFFCLSGFLLSIPFVKNPSLIRSPNYLQHYFIRRIKRIVPMYYFILSILQLFKGNFEIFVRHAIFIQGDSIFWTIPQEMFFYIILPFVLIINYYICRGNVVLITLLTLCMALFFNQNYLSDFVFIYGNHKKLPLWVGVFLIGVCASYFYHSPYAKIITQKPLIFHNVVGIFLISIVILSSNIPYEKLPIADHFSTNNVEVYSFIAALLLFFSISSDRSILNRIMSCYPLRAIGIVGFSFYLVHPNVLDMINATFDRMIGEAPHSLLLLAIALPLTYFISMITYSLIERPFIFHSK